MSESIPANPEEMAELAIHRMIEQKSHVPGCVDVVLLARHGDFLDLVSVGDPDKLSRLVGWFNRAAKDVIACVMIIKDSSGVSLDALVFKPCAKDAEFQKLLSANMDNYVSQTHHILTSQISGKSISEIAPDL